MSALGKIIAAVVLAPIAILVAGIGGCEATKAYYDRQVREMCEKDGGATVYERMALSPEVFEKMKGVTGAVLVPHESAQKTEIPVYWRSEERRIREGHPSITRTEITIIRRSGAKVLGKDVQYGRSGGDFPFTASAPSYFVCPALSTSLEKQVFLVEGERK